MKASDIDVFQVKKDIRQYYSNKKAIDGQHRRLEALARRIKGIEEDMKNPLLRHSLKTYVQGMAYDGVVVSGGALPSSGMEREIEGIYRQLEKELRQAQGDVLQAKAAIRELENKNSIMEFYIGMLSEDCKRLLNMKFGERKSIVQIAVELNLSEATINRYFVEIYNSIYKVKCYYEKT